MKGYKAFDKNLQCREFQFEVGKTFEIKGKLEICKNGFHFCEQLKDVFNYYPKSYESRICEIEAFEVIKEGDKSATNKIKILRELSKEEIKSLTDDLKFNSGDYNSGHNNSGHNNSGYYNSGHNNSGYYNSGDYNSGHKNSGDYNSGDYNSGHNNSGRYNSGHNNSGYYNSGHNNSGRYNSGHNNSGRYNSGHNNSGYYNSVKSKIKMFNKDTDLYHDSDIILKFNSIIDKYWKPHLTYVYTKDMTEEEKTNNPSHKTTGGFLRLEKESGYKKSWEKVWSKCAEAEKEFIKSLPNFDAEIFLDITGIDVRIESIEVTVNGQTKKISKKDAEKLGLI